MHIEVKRTFIEIVDEDETESRRRCSAPASISLKEQIMNLQLPQSHLRDAPPERFNKDHEHAAEPKTTLILRNVPPSYTRARLLELLDEEGFACSYDFVYLPIKIKWNTAFGYAFINFVNEDFAESFRKHFTQFNRWGAPCDRCAEVDWTKGHQGLEAQKERYRESPLMQLNSPDEMRPIVLKDGVRVPFPETAPNLANLTPGSFDLNALPRTEGGPHRKPHASKCTTQRNYAANSKGSYGVAVSDVIDVSSPCSMHNFSEFSESGDEQTKLRTQKKADRSVKRIQSKLLKFGRNN